jgi:hypothetical protein
LFQISPDSDKLRFGGTILDPAKVAQRIARPVLPAHQRQKALQRLSDGASISAVAREMKTSRATIMRVGRGAAA